MIGNNQGSETARGSCGVDLRTSATLVERMLPTKNIDIDGI
jgi:hypothetical protein